MSQFDRIQIWQRFLEARIVPLFYTPDVQVARTALDVCAQAGLRVVEFTHRGEGAPRVFEALLEYRRERWPDVALGVGTVLDAGTAIRYINLGADFVVSPVFDEATARACHRRGVVYVPGCATPTEILRATEAGAPLVKLFPATPLGGPPYLRAIRAVLPHVHIMPTGGIPASRDALAAWFDAGACCVGLGSALGLTTEHDPHTPLRRIRALLGVEE